MVARLADNLFKPRIGWNTTGIMYIFSQFEVGTLHMYFHVQLITWFMLVSSVIVAILVASQGLSFTMPAAADPV